MFIYRSLLVVLIGFSASNVFAQKNSNAFAVTGSASAETGEVLHYGQENEPARAIEFKERTVTSDHFLNNIHRYFKIPADFTFEEQESNTDHLGIHHRFLQQFYNGVPIEGMGYRVHEMDGFVRSANGRAVRDVQLNTNVLLTEEEAFHHALQLIQTKDTTTRPGKKLIVSKNFTFASGSFAVAYQFDIDVSLIEHWRVSIDANTGDLINKVSLVNTCSEEHRPLPYGEGSGLTNYYGKKNIKVTEFEGGGSQLKGQTEHGGILGTYDFRNVSIFSLILFFEWHEVYDFYSGNNTYHTEYLKPAASVQWAAEQVYEYYFTKHNRNSFDNNGSEIKSYVHVDVELNNAFWTHNLLAFGDGSNNNPLVELDVVGHEFTHGVTQYEAGLAYQSEPGALNESFSDILGKAIEFEVFGDTATWELARRAIYGGLRDLSNPNLRNQPDTYYGHLWYTGYEDNGGVHYNSGVQNYWFYLLCEGGSGVNDNGLSYSVNRVGMDTAINIVYRNLTEYLGNYSDYLDSRIGSMLAAADLYGKGSVAYREVDKAWDAVGVIDEPIITSLELFDITATTVKLKGSLLPRGDTVTYYFEYGPTPDFGTTSSTYSYTDKVEGILRDLQSDTHYYLRMVAKNENGPSYYAGIEFTTLPLDPLVKIKNAIDLTETTAAFSGEINPNSLNTSFYFQYGLTSELELSTAPYPVSDTTEFVDVSASVIHLQPRRTYYYKLVGTNSSASAKSETLTFFTALRPVINSCSPMTAHIGTEVTIVGENFNPVAEKNHVSFGATRASVLSATTTEIKVTVPTGASLGPITVLDVESGLSTKSIMEFVPTYTGDFDKQSLQLTFATNDSYVGRTVVDDMDGDGRPDIFASHNTGFSVFLNTNTGGAITESSFSRSQFPMPIYGPMQIADFDGNGLKDVIGYTENNLRILPNLSVAGFVFFGPPIDLSIEYLSEIMVDDFDLDGRIDIAGKSYTSLDSSVIVIIRNQRTSGAIESASFVEQYNLVVPYNPYYMETGDMNNDSKPDLITGPYGSQFASIFLNGSTPANLNFEEHQVEDMTRGRFVRYVPGDFNNDGWKDLVSVSQHEAGDIAIHENISTSADFNMGNEVIIHSEYDGSFVWPGDINGDGRVDLLVLKQREFTFLENKTNQGEKLSASSFEKFSKHGMTLPPGAGTVESRITINDLNGDGRPEVINTHGYYYGPRDGYLMEIWQNSSDVDCPDPSDITLDISGYEITVMLPDGASFEQYDIEYSYANQNYWRPVESSEFDVSLWAEYTVRVRAKCYLGYTDYHYINFSAECVDKKSFTISHVDVNFIVMSAPALSAFEIQYSVEHKGDWFTVLPHTDKIADLLPGTTYDLRFRGRCADVTAFNYITFTTLCPQLTSITIEDITHDQAYAKLTANYGNPSVIQYSTDNLTWAEAGSNGVMQPLIPVTKYFVRAAMQCTDIASDYIYESFNTRCPSVYFNVDHITPFSATLNWTNNYQSQGFTIRYRPDGGKENTVLSTSGTSLDITGLKPGTEYIVSVAPDCTAEPVFVSTTFTTHCFVPFDLKANSVTYTSAALSWSDDIAGVPYVVEYTITDSENWITNTTDSMSISLRDLRPGTEYEVRVYISCPEVEELFVSERFITDLYEETTHSPNPTEDIITIYPSRDLIGRAFIIVDQTGRTMFSGMLTDYTLNLEGYTAGVYTLKIEGEMPMKIFKR